MSTVLKMEIVDDITTEVERGSALRLDSLGIGIGLLREVAIIRQGPSHRWWLSARLLLGMTEAEAQTAHETARLPVSVLTRLTGGVEGG